jgi:DNA-binding transcriptional MerR regulator
MHLNDHASFSGNAADLASLAVDCAQGMRLPVDAGKTNERLVRYYVTEGVLDRPDRVGRDAAYGFRHLLQLLTAKRMVEAGMTLAVVAQHNQASTTKALQKALERPLPTAAEMLVQTFMSGGAGKAPLSQARGSRQPARQQPPNQASSSTPSPMPRPSMALTDVLAEVRQMRDEVMARMNRLERERGDQMAQLMDRFEQELQQMRQGLERVNRALEQIQDRFPKP